MTLVTSIMDKESVTCWNDDPFMSWSNYHNLAAQTKQGRHYGRYSTYIYIVWIYIVWSMNLARSFGPNGIKLYSQMAGGNGRAKPSCPPLKLWPLWFTFTKVMTDNFKLFSLQQFPKYWRGLVPNLVSYPPFITRVKSIWLPLNFFRPILKGEATGIYLLIQPF